jgi:MraZ protein
VFTGEYRHSVDDKGRIAVPVKFRAQLLTGSMVSGWFEDCLALHTKEGWDELAAKSGSLRVTDSTSRDFQRWLFSTASDAQIDKQGRILLPAYLRDHIGLGSEVVLVGSQDHAEIWAPERWDAYRKKLDDPQQLAKAFEGLGI